MKWLISGGEPSRVLSLTNNGVSKSLKWMAHNNRFNYDPDAFFAVEESPRAASRRKKCVCTQKQFSATLNLTDV